MNSLSLSYPSTYIFKGDLFGDFIKVVVSYPGAKNLNINSHFGLMDIFSDYIKNNPYKGVDGLGAGVLTHFHLPPLTTLVSLASLSLMHVLPPQLVFYLALALVLFLTFVIINFLVIKINEKLILLFCFFASYPFLFALQRGNLFSVVTSLAIFYFVLSTLKNKNIFLGLLCMAIALNIRPNAIFFFPILILAPNHRWLFRLFGLLALTVTIFILSIFIDALIYPDYSLISFIKGLSIYHIIYVIGTGGDSYNSSIFNLLKILFHYSWFLEFIGLVSGILILGIAVLGYIKRLLDSTSLIFILCVAYMCGTSTFADYHLLIFMLPVTIICSDITKLSSSQTGIKGLPQTYWIIYFTCIFILAPKNYIFNQNGISIFILLNPLIAIISISLLCFSSSVSTKKLVDSSSKLVVD